MRAMSPSKVAKSTPEAVPPVGVPGLPPATPGSTGLSESSPDSAQGQEPESSPESTPESAPATVCKDGAGGSSDIASTRVARSSLPAHCCARALPVSPMRATSG